ncbi:MAG: hypothetical protein U0793_29975 [Gemmataceae bacterium]
MQKIPGVTPGGAKPRELTVWLAQDEEEPRLHLWIHPPDAGGGWEIRVREGELKEALAGLASSTEVPDRPAAANLVDYFQDGRWRPALRRYAQYAEQSGWSLAHRFALYGQAKIAFDASTDEESRGQAFEYVYNSLRDYAQVFRGAASRWDAETAFTFFTEHQAECGPQSVRTLESLSKSETNQILLPFLDKLHDIRILTGSTGYPVAAASRFLHFFNPHLFPIFDDILTNREVLQVFGAEFDRYIADTGAGGWNDDSAFYGQYVLWASRHIQLADPELFDDFATWFGVQVEGEEDDNGVLAEIKTYHAALFEFVAVGAAKLQLEG